MPRIHPGLAGQGEDPVLDRPDQLVPGPAREIGPPHSSEKQRVSGQQQAFSLKAHAPGRMTGCVQDGKAGFSEPDLVPFTQKRVRFR